VGGGAHQAAADRLKVLAALPERLLERRDVGVAPGAQHGQAGGLTSEPLQGQRAVEVAVEQLPKRRLVVGDPRARLVTCQPTLALAAHQKRHGADPPAAR